MFHVKHFCKVLPEGKPWAMVAEAFFSRREDPMRSATLIILLLFAAASFIAIEDHRFSPICAAPGRSLAEIQLIFGASRKDAPPVSDTEWAGFLAEEVTPRFPDGLTVLTGAGQWRDSQGTLVRESSRLLLIWYEPQAGANEKIEAIRTAYKTRFGQESVLRADGAPACVSF